MTHQPQWYIVKDIGIINNLKLYMLLIYCRVIEYRGACESHAFRYGVMSGQENETRII